ncbi:Class E vacuolar protein-sorting machinery protein HSE1 [Fusarium oxysporum f. sp. albedinis]|nr:Class E vacuolar protein-sorting machinery protein HSE1 [Fusarium oxysporum f. sp. albedinis]
MVDYVLGQGPSRGDPDIVSPWQDEQKIACIVSALEHVLDRCEMTARHTGRSLLCWLRSSRLESCGQNPFTLLAEDTFVIRGHRMPTSVRESETKIRLDVEHSKQLQRIWEHQVWAAIDVSRGFWPARPSYAENYTPLHGAQPEISGPMRWGDARPSSNEEYDAESDEDNYETSEDEDELDNGPGYLSDSGESYVEAQPRPGSQSVTESGDTVFRDFLELLFQFCISLSTESFLDGQASSTMLIYFSGILGFSDDSRQFLLVRPYCPQLSCIVYVQRLLFLEYALPLHPYHTLGIQQRPQEQQLEQLNDIRRRYMVTSSQTALAELLSLRDSGRAIARTEPPSFFLNWSDDGQSVRIGDSFSLTIEDFRQLPGYFIARAEELTAKLMFNIEPDINLATVKDDLRNTQTG